MRTTIMAAVALAGFGLALGSAGARADEVTTTTTTHKETPAEPGVVVGVPGVVGVQIGGGHSEGCVTHKETRTDTETGDTVSRKSTDCN